jgi:hypothetical protein
MSHWAFQSIPSIFSCASFLFICCLAPNCLIFALHVCMPMHKTQATIPHIWTMLTYALTSEVERACKLASSRAS